MPPILEVQHLAVAFGDRVAIEGLSFRLDRGQTLFVLGPNGGGKSVLLRALVGSIPHRGALRWEPGVRLGYVPQRIDADRHLPLTARDLLELKARVIGLPHPRIAEVTDVLRLGDAILDVPFGILSSGQAQRVLIAAGLVGDPEVLLLDEPAANLDQGAKAVFEDLLVELRRTRPLTVIHVSHDLELARRDATVVLGLDHHAICFGPPASVLTAEVVSGLFVPHAVERGRR